MKLSLTTQMTILISFFEAACLRLHRSSPPRGYPNFLLGDIKFLCLTSSKPNSCLQAFVSNSRKLQIAVFPSTWNLHLSTHSLPNLLSAAWFLSLTRAYGNNGRRPRQKFVLSYYSSYYSPRLRCNFVLPKTIARAFARTKGNSRAELSGPSKRNRLHNAVDRRRSYRRQHGGFQNGGGLAVPAALWVLAVSIGPRGTLCPPSGATAH